MKGLVADSPAAERALLRAGAESPRPTYDAVAPGALAVPHRAGRASACARRGVGRCRRGSHLEREGRFAAAMSLIRLKRDDEAFGVASHAAEHRAGGGGGQRDRRGAAPARGRAAVRTRHLLLQSGDRARPGRRGLLLQPWLRLLDGEGPARRPRTGCAKPSGAILPTATHTSSSSAALQQTGAAAEAARERELARSLSSRYAQWEARAAGGGEPIPRGLERLHERLDVPSARVDAIIASSGQRDQAGAGRLPPRCGPPGLRARVGSRGGAGAAAGALPVAVHGRGPPAARTPAPAGRPRGSRRAGAEDCHLERRQRRGARHSWARPIWPWRTPLRPESSWSGPLALNPRSADAARLQGAAACRRASAKIIAIKPLWLERRTTTAFTRFS